MKGKERKCKEMKGNETTCQEREENEKIAMMFSCGGDGVEAMPIRFWYDVEMLVA